jgi:hypothetical protein
MPKSLVIVPFITVFAIGCTDEDTQAPGPTTGADTAVGSGPPSGGDAAVHADVAAPWIDGDTADAAMMAFSPKTSCSTPTKLSDNLTTTHVAFAALASEPGGRAVLAYADLLKNTTKRTMRARIFDGTTWGSLATLGDTADGGRFRNIAIDPGGTALVGFALDGGAEGARHVFANNVWQNTGNVEQSSNESAILGFISATRPLSLSHGIGAPSYALRDTTGWTALTPLMNGGDNTSRVEIARTESGAVVAWADINNALHAHFFSNTQALPPAGTLAMANAVGTIDHLALVPLPGNQALIAWYRRTPGPTRELMVSTLSHNGENAVFAAPTAVAKGEEFVNLQGVADTNGDVTITFTLAEGTKAVRRVAGVWSAPFLLGKGWLDTRPFAIDAAGHVTVLLKEDDGKIYHRRVARGTNTWTVAHRVDTPAFPAATGHHGVGVNAAGDPFLVWPVMAAGDATLVWSTCR